MVTKQEIDDEVLEVLTGIAEHELADNPRFLLGIIAGLKAQLRDLADEDSEEDEDDEPNDEVDDG
jgi:hypothetical protein